MNPLRPWDRPNRNYLLSPSTQNHYMGNNSLNPSSQVNSSAFPVPLHEIHGLNTQSQATTAPPAPPPRTNSTSRIRRSSTHAAYDGALAYNGYGGYSRYGGYGGGYGGYGGYGGGYGGYGGGYGGYGGGYGMYGGYGGYGMNAMNRGLQPNPNDPERQFIRLAEESSRPAFQSIESLVEAFHSVSIMLDSTLHAVHTLFRAVLGMADNFGRLRSLFNQFFSSIALFRLFIWAYRKLLYLAGLARNNPNREEIWQNAAAELGGQIAEELGQSTERQRPAWPILLFLGIVFTGPYLIFKFINSLTPSSRRNEDGNVILWNPVTQPGYLRVALYDYSATSEDELTFRAGQKMIVAPANLQPPGGWLYACLGNSRKVGLVPGNYLASPRLPGQLRSTAKQSQPSQLPSTSSATPAVENFPSPAQPLATVPEISEDVTAPQLPNLEPGLSNTTPETPQVTQVTNPSPVQSLRETISQTPSSEPTQCVQPESQQDSIPQLGLPESATQLEQPRST